MDVDVGAASKMPYRVRLDDTGGRSVLVHRDEHRFIRSRDLQAPGPRTGATRALDKFVTRQKKDGSWEKVDHEWRLIHLAPRTQLVDDPGEVPGGPDLRVLGPRRVTYLVDKQQIDQICVPPCSGDDCGIKDSEWYYGMIMSRMLMMMMLSVLYRPERPLTGIRGFRLKIP